MAGNDPGDFSHLIPKMQVGPADGAIPTQDPTIIAGGPGAGAATGPPPPLPDAQNMILQHIAQAVGPDYAASRTANPAKDAALGLVYDIFHPTDASPGPQTTRDWLTKTYHPYPSDFVRDFVSGATYGLDPQARNLVNAGATAVGQGSNIPFTAQGARDANQAAMDRSGPMGPVVSGLGMYVSPITRFGIAPLGDAAFRGTSALIKAAGPLAEKYLPDAITGASSKIAPYVPEALPQKIASGTAQAGATGGIQGAGQADSPNMVLPDVGYGMLKTAPWGLANAVLPGQTMPIHAPSDAADTAMNTLQALRFRTSDVKQAANAAMTKASGGGTQQFDSAAAPTSTGLFGALETGVPQTAQSLVNMRDQMRVIAAGEKDPRSAEYKFATIYGDALDSVLRKQAPMAPGEMEGGATPPKTAPQEAGTAATAADVLTGVQNLQRPPSPGRGGPDQQLVDYIKGLVPSAGGGYYAAQHFLGADPTTAAALGGAATVAAPLVRKAYEGTRYLADTAARQAAVDMPYYKMMTGLNQGLPATGQALMRLLLAGR